MIAIATTVISGIVVSIVSMQLDKISKREDKRDNLIEQLEQSIKHLEISDRDCSHKIDRIHDLFTKRSENAQLKYAIILDTIDRIEDQLNKTTNYTKTVHKKAVLNPLETLTSYDNEDFTGFL